MDIAIARTEVARLALDNRASRVPRLATDAVPAHSPSRDEGASGRFDAQPPPAQPGDRPAFVY